MPHWCIGDRRFKPGSPLTLSSSLFKPSAGWVASYVEQMLASFKLVARIFRAGPPAMIQRLIGGLAIIPSKFYEFLSRDGTDTHLACTCRVHRMGDEDG